MSSQPPSASAPQGSAAPATWAAASVTARSSSVRVKSIAARPLEPEAPAGDDAPQHLVGPAPDGEARGDQPGREQVAAERLAGPGRPPGPLRRHLDHLLLDVGGEHLG